MSTRRYSKTIYLRVTPEKHEAVSAYAARKGSTVSGVVDALLDGLLAEAVASPALRKLDERIAALESRMRNVG